VRCKGCASRTENRNQSRKGTVGQKSPGPPASRGSSQPRRKFASTLGPALSPAMPPFPTSPRKGSKSPVSPVIREQIHGAGLWPAGQMNIQRYPDDDPHHAATIVIKAGA
jgi:hypothetical protein